MHLKSFQQPKKKNTLHQSVKQSQYQLHQPSTQISTNTGQPDWVLWSHMLTEEMANALFKGKPKAEEEHMTDDENK